MKWAWRSQLHSFYQPGSGLLVEIYVQLVVWKSGNVVDPDTNKIAIADKASGWNVSSNLDLDKNEFVRISNSDPDLIIILFYIFIKRYQLKKVRN